MAILESIIGAVIKEGTKFFTDPLKDRLFPKNKAARKIYALYESIDDCQAAYIKALEWNSRNNIADYDEKLRRVSGLIIEVKTLLQIYHKGLCEILEGYMAMSLGPDPGELLEQRLKAKDVDQSDYEKAKDQLGEFIKSNFKMEDLM
jgi:hypothetical protein